MPPEMESPGENIMLIETVKSMVTHEGRNQSGTADEDFFLMTQDQAVQYPEESAEETVPPADVELTWMHLCRICANSSDHTVPIFEGEGEEHDLPSKILKYLPIHVCTINAEVFQSKYRGKRRVGHLPIAPPGIRKRHSAVATVRELRQRPDSLARVERRVLKRGEKAAGDARHAAAK